MACAVMKWWPSATSEAVHAAAAGGLLDEHIISPAPTTERLQSIQRMVADQLGVAVAVAARAGRAGSVIERAVGEVRQAVGGTTLGARLDLVGASDRVLDFTVQGRLTPRLRPLVR